MKIVNVLLLALGIALIIFGGIDKSKPSDNDKEVIKTHLYTHEHDGHKFIAYGMFGRPGGILHHPDCECKKEN